MATLNKNANLGKTCLADGTPTQVTYYDSGSITTIGTSGTTPAKATDGTQQSATDLLSGLQVAGSGSVNAPDNFLASTAVAGGVPTMNPAQSPSAGKSLAPGHE
jgi:hypothetical protein